MSLNQESTSPELRAYERFVNSTLQDAAIPFVDPSKPVTATGYKSGVCIWHMSAPLEYVIVQAKVPSAMGRHARATSAKLIQESTNALKAVLVSAIGPGPADQLLIVHHTDALKLLLPSREQCGRIFAESRHQKRMRSTH